MGVSAETLSHPWMPTSTGGRQSEAYERRFLITSVPENAEVRDRYHVKQAYVKFPHEAEELRIRSIDDKRFFIELKRRVDPPTKQSGCLKRKEREEPLKDGKAEFEKLLKTLANGKVLDMEVERIRVDGLTININHYFGGRLSIAEVKFKSEAAGDSFQPLSWFGEEVTFVDGFRHSVMARSGAPTHFSGIEKYLRGDPIRAEYASDKGLEAAIKLVDAKLQEAGKHVDEEPGQPAQKPQRRQSEFVFGEPKVKAQHPHLKRRLSKLKAEVGIQVVDPSDFKHADILLSRLRHVFTVSDDNITNYFRDTQTDSVNGANGRQSRNYIEHTHEPDTSSESAEDEQVGIVDESESTVDMYAGVGDPKASLLRGNLIDDPKPQVSLCLLPASLNPPAQKFDVLVYVYSPGNESKLKFALDASEKAGIDPKDIVVIRA